MLQNKWLKKSTNSDGTGFYFFIAALITTLLVFVVLRDNPMKPETFDVPFDAKPLPDFSVIADISERKQAFFDYLRPIVENVNGNIVSERQEVESLYDYFQHKQFLSKRQWQRVLVLAKKYRLSDEETIPDESIFQELLNRIAPIPESLVLAQAANESAWGRSRFAREGNNLFGQWCFQEGCGLVPKGRPEGKTYEVALFDSPFNSVESYMKNLNTFHLYEDFRQIRAELLVNNEPLSGKRLADGLVRYSTRGEEYIAELKKMIEQNDLE